MKENIEIHRRDGVITISNNPIIAKWQYSDLEEEKNSWAPLTFEELKWFYYTIILVLTPVCVGIWLRVFELLSNI